VEPALTGFRRPPRLGGHGKKEPDGAGTGMSREYTTCEGCRLVKETPAAILVQVPMREKPIWFPKSHLGPFNELIEEGDEGTLECTEWIATEKGIV
jgi:hypothetical protein